MRISDWSSDVCSSDLLVRYGHGLDHCGRLTGNDLTLFRCDVALLRGLSAASCQSKYQRGGARQGNESRHICLLLVSAGHARNSETLPSLPNAIISNASTLPSGISIPGEPRGIPATAVPQMTRGF